MVCLLRKWKLVLVLEHEITDIERQPSMHLRYSQGLSACACPLSSPQTLPLGKGVDRLVLASQDVCRFL